jgi:hypothetical protein
MDNQDKRDFKDKIVIDGKTVLELPIEHILHEDVPTVFKSKWSSREDNIRVQSRFNRLDNNKSRMNANDIVFDPIKAMMNPQIKLAITADPNPRKFFLLFIFLSLYLLK